MEERKKKLQIFMGVPRSHTQRDLINLFRFEVRKKQNKGFNKELIYSYDLFLQKKTLYLHLNNRKKNVLLFPRLETHNSNKHNY